MDSRRSLKETLSRIVEDLNMISKQLAVIMCLPRDQRSCSSQECEVFKLVELFKRKEQELAEGMKIAEEQAERQKIIDQLYAEVKKRDDCIEKIFACFKESEDVLINAIFQANQKLKSIGEANRKKVSPDELIKYAHRISASNSVAAPLTWQQGDPQRPYPIEVEMWQGWPERSKERAKMDKESLSVSSNVGRSQTDVSVVISGGFTPPQQQQQQEFFARPQGSSGTFPAPAQVPQSPVSGSGRQVASASAGGWASPRAAHQTSPRAAPTPMAARPATRSPYGGGGCVSSVGGVVIKAENVGAGETVEQMSSDSSSSSDSDSQ